MSFQVVIPSSSLMLAWVNVENTALGIGSNSVSCSSTRYGVMVRLRRAESSQLSLMEKKSVVGCQVSSPGIWMLAMKAFCPRLRSLSQQLSSLPGCLAKVPGNVNSTLRVPAASVTR